MAEGTRLLSEYGGKPPSRVRIPPSPLTASADTAIGRRALGRALLQRQHLLARVRLTPAEVIEGLVGLQAQEPLPPYVGLWSRIEGFDPRELGRMISEREVVRTPLMRGTVHMTRPRDAAFLRPLTQPAIERGHNGAFGRRMGNATPERIASATRELLAGSALTARELGRALVERGIGDDPEAIGNATRVYAPLVQVPPRAVWGQSGRARYATFEDWTGLSLEAEPSRETLVRRYLGAFGPASVIDAQNWSGLTRLKAVFERLRPELVSLRDEDGRELFDLPDAPRPDPETPAPVRLLGEYDNLLLGHADRRRVIPEDFPWRPMLAPGRFVYSLLVDGMLRATWWLERDGKRSALLAIRPAGRFAKAERADVEAEAARVVDWVAADAERRDVRFEPPV